MRLFMHTAKAVRGGHPADRLFVVVSSSIGSTRSKPLHLAWKVTIGPNGLQHPAYFAHVDATVANLTAMSKLKKGLNGSEPTGMFREDSFYREVTITDIEAEIESYKFAREEERKAKAKSTVAVVTASRDDVSIVNFEIRNAGEISAELREKIKVETARFKKILEDMIKES